MPKKAKDLAYNSKGISIVIKNDIKPYEEPAKPKRKSKRKIYKKASNHNFLDTNNNQAVDSKIPIYRDLYNRNINNIPQPQMVDWQAVRLGLLPPPPAPPPPPPPTLTPPMITPPSYTTTNNFPAITYPDPINGMAKLMDSMRPFFLTNNPYNTEDENYSYGRGVDIVELSPEDAMIEEEAKRVAEEKVLEDTIDEAPLDEEEMKKRKEREKYLTLEDKIAGFGTGKLKQGASKSAGSLKAPAYIFNEEYMTRYNEVLDQKENDIQNEINDKRAQITAKTEAIRLEGDTARKDKLKKEKKDIQKELSLITKKIDKIQKLKESIAEQQKRYTELFP